MLEVEPNFFEDIDFHDTDIVSVDDTIFDDLVAHVAEQPDDEQAYEDIKQLVIASYENGEVDKIQRMAMTLGAMACLDSHFEELANEASSFTEQHTKDDGHDHEEEKAKKHDSKTCKDCKAGRHCRKRS